MSAPRGARSAGVVLLAALAGAGVADAEGATAPARTLRVATGQIPPFVIQQDGQLTGFSVDLWNALARRIRVDSSSLDLGLHSQSDQVQAVANGKVDVAISAIVMTPEREEKVDFTIPYLDSGLQIMVRVDRTEPFWTTVVSLFSPALRKLLAAGAIAVFLLAHVLWFIERRRNPSFQKGYLRGIGEGLWGVVLIIATGEYGDRETPEVVRRLTVVFMWLLGVGLIAQLTATVTSSLTVRQLRSDIRGPEDLPGKTIATIPGSTAAQYLTRLGLPFTPMADAETGYALLMGRQAQAIVYEAPTLQYWAARRGKGLLQVVGPVFMPQKLGIAVAQGSPLRKQIDEALLEMYADGSYEEIQRKWFASPK